MRLFFSKTKTGVTMQSAESTLPTPVLRCLVNSISETGPVRDHNEDAISLQFLSAQRDELIAVLADGMGGHNAGEVASKMACSIIIEETTRNRNDANALEKALQETHKKIGNAGNANAAQNGMGTTATAVWIHQNILQFSHVGDSRLYQYHNGIFTQLTKDHTFVNDLYEKGEITLKERDTHPMKNVLLQALGTANLLNPHSGRLFPLQKDDKYLLCSDGIYEVFNDEQLAELMKINDPSFLLECMRCVAYERKASDNFSAILITFSDDFLQTPPITKEQNILP